MEVRLQPGGIDFLESILGLLKSLKIRALGFLLEKNTVHTHLYSIQIDGEVAN